MCEGSFSRAEDTRFVSVDVFSPCVLKTVTALEKYPGGPGWERARQPPLPGEGARGPASGGGDGGAQRRGRRGSGERRGGCGCPPGEEGREPGRGAEGVRGAEPPGALSAGGPPPSTRGRAACTARSRGARAGAREAGPGRGPGAGGASELEPEPRSRPSGPRPERALEMPALGERAPAARQAPRRR